MNTTERAVSRRPAWVRGRAVRASALAAVAALAGVSGALAASRSTTVSSSNNPTYGRILIGPSKRTLYVFCPGTSTRCTGQSAKGWPALIASGRVVAASGSQINSKKLGTHKLKNGQLQVTYYGQPLYHYTGDTKAGQTNGEGKTGRRGTWLVISVQGRGLQNPNQY